MWPPWGGGAAGSWRRSHPPVGTHQGCPDTIVPGPPPTCRGEVFATGRGRSAAGETAVAAAAAGTPMVRGRWRDAQGTFADEHFLYEVVTERTPGCEHFFLSLHTMVRGRFRQREVVMTLEEIRVAS